MAWGIVYFKTRDGKVPAEDFLDACPAKIEARFHAVLDAVRDAPPPQFSGGGYWEAMHGDMGGVPRDSAGRSWAPPVSALLRT
jgi:hypothetical protein